MPKLIEMKDVKFKPKPESYELFYKGSYKNCPFTVQDKDGEVFVCFDTHYEATSSEYSTILDKIKEMYINRHKKDKKWHK